MIAQLCFKIFVFGKWKCHTGMQSEKLPTYKTSNAKQRRENLRVEESYNENEI